MLIFYFVFNCIIYIALWKKVSRRHESVINCKRKDEGGKGNDRETLDKQAMS